MATRRQPAAALASNVSPETVLAAQRELTASRRRIHEAQGEHRATAKRWKAAGVNIKAMSEVISNHALDPDEVTRHYRDVFHYGALNGAAYATQTDLFPVEGLDLHVTDAARAEHQEWEASEQGYNAGRAGTPMEDCPYPVASPLAQVWSRQWHRGQASLAQELNAGESAPVGRRRRGRPAKTNGGATASTSPA